MFNFIKKAFGFSSDSDIYDDDEDIAIDATVTPLNRRQPDDASGTAKQGDTTVNQPDFDITTYIKDSLATDIDRLVSSIATAATQASEARVDAERQKNSREIAELQARINDTNGSADEKSKQLLSSERQRRALNDRIRDLEAQIANLEAEKEQFQLENRTLANKMRVMNVLGDNTSDESVDAMAQTISRFEAEKAELTARIETLTAQADLSQTMFNDLNQRASEARHELSARDEEIEKLKARIESSADLVTDLQKQLNDKTEQANILEDKLQQAHTNLETAAQIQDQVEKFQEILDKKNAQISKLSADLRHRDDRINALEQEEQSLRNTIQNNLNEQAKSEQELRARIDTLEQQLNKPRKSRKATSTRPATTPVISAIDDDLDNTDWLVATPPEGTTVKTSGVSDAEFGYQEPLKKTPPENSAQMSLW